MAQLAEVPFLPGHRLLLSMGGLTKVGAEWVSVEELLNGFARWSAGQRPFLGFACFREKEMGVVKKKWVWSGRTLDHTLRQEE